jgi:hypothetical protein
MFLIQHVNGKILHCLVHFEGQRTIFWYRLIFVVSLYGLNLYRTHLLQKAGLIGCQEDATGGLQVLA